MTTLISSFLGTLFAQPIPAAKHVHHQFDTPLLTESKRLTDLYAADVKDRASFARFVGQLMEDYLEHPEEWENRSLPDFLASLQAHALDITQHYRVEHAPDKLQEERPSWRHFADVLLHARVSGPHE